MRYIKSCMLCTSLLLGMTAQADILYQDNFDNDGLATNTGIGGGAANRTIQAHSWTDNGDATFVTAGTSYTRRAILYSENTFQSDTGFRLTASFTTGTIGDSAAHNLSIGLVSAETDLATYTGYNPFLLDNTVYSIGANVTADISEASRGLNFTDGSVVTTLDQSGTRAQFKAGETCEVTIEVGIGGYWCYRIDGVYEASGVLLEGFDLSKSYHVVVYGQDDHGGGKVIESLSLETAPAAGERADHLRGTWSAGGEAGVDGLKDFKTMDFMGVGFNSGATQSALHFVPHKLLESLSEGDVDENGERINLVVPLWGDLSLENPEHDVFLEEILDIQAEGFQVQAYSNCKNFVGGLGESYTVFVERWKAWCDTDPEAQAFINSQPYHTGIWNRTTQQYEDAESTYPDRKYMFCYAEFVLKDYSLRYGQHFDRWIFDSGDDIPRVGDNGTSGLIEEQRLFQAFTNAVRAGNPDIPVAYNLGRSNIHYDGFPFHIAVQFEDFTFGHAYGGNTDHGSKENGAFDRNYNHVIRMVETDAYVHTGGAWEWDDLIIGNFHSKLATTSWSDGPFQAWEEADFLQWNEEALTAGGSMTWGGSTYIHQGVVTLRPWAYDLLKALDDHLSEFESPGAPNWARSYTVLPAAAIGEAYYHRLEEGVDFWDPEGDSITSLLAVNGAPSWLSIAEDPNNEGHWILSGTPTETVATSHRFTLEAMDVNNQIGARDGIELIVNDSASTLTDLGDGIPVWDATPLTSVEAYKYQEYQSLLVRGLDFEDFDGDALVVSKTSGPAWLNLEAYAPNIWKLSGTPATADVGVNTIELALSDGSQTVTLSIAINVSDAQFLNMEVNSINGGAYWANLSGDAYNYYNTSNNFDYRSLMYTSQSFQSNGGFKLTVNYTAENVGVSLAHNFSFGLIQANTDLATYSGMNPFAADNSVYSIGVNLTAVQGEDARGLNFTNGQARTTLDASGTNVQFPTNASTEVTIEIGLNGAWTYSIDGIVEASGVIPEGFDLSQEYHVAVYGQDDNGGEKSIQSVSLDLLEVPSIGLVAEWSLDDGSGTVVTDDSALSFDATAINGTWVAGLDGGAIDFNGNNSSVILPKEAFAYVNDEISFAFWQYGDSSQARADTLLNAVNSAGQRVLNIHLPWSNQSVYWDAGYNGGSYDRIDKTATAAAYKGQWNHWVFTKNANSGEMHIYLNGALWHSGSGLTNDMAGIVSIALGNSADAVSSYDGIIDEVQLYNIELNAAEISSLANSYTTSNGVPKLWLIANGIEPTDAGALADADGDGLTNWEEYQNGNDPLVQDNPAGIRVTEYYLTTGDFTGTSLTLALDQNLADDYFIFVRGSHDGNGLSMPNNDYARVTGVPYGSSRYPGDMVGSGNNHLITLERSVADFDWEGVVTVIECTNPSSSDGFKLIDIISTDMTTASGTDTSATWSNVDQVTLFGGYRGGGATFIGIPTERKEGTSVYTRLSPSGSHTVNWSRDAGGETLYDTVITTFVIEWGSEWNIQHVNVTGSNGGNGADSTTEYTTATINSVNRDNTWIWATGTRADSGIGDSSEACLVTLGDGVTQNTTESTVAVGSEYTDAYDFDVYTLTHPDLAVDHRFKTDGDSSSTDLAVTVDSTNAGARFGWVYNGCNGTGNYFPRPRLWSRYTDDSTITLSRGFSGQDFPAWIQGIDFSALND